MTTISPSIRSKLSNAATSFGTASTSSFSSFSDILARKARDVGTVLGPEEVTSSEIEDIVEAVERNAVWVGGRDSWGRPIVHVSLSTFPVLRPGDIDPLLQLILERLSSTISQPYILILFASADTTVASFSSGPTPLSAPSWRFILAAYRRLPRPVRKGCKELYIIHPTPFTSRILTLASYVLSAKFWSKVKYTSRLSELRSLLGEETWNSGALIVPGGVIKHNIQNEDHSLPPLPISTDLVRDLDRLKIYIKSVQKHLDVSGLFRVSSSKMMAKAVEDLPICMLERVLDDLGEQGSILSAGLIKGWFRNLPQPLIPDSDYDLLKTCPPITTVTDVSLQLTNDQEAISWVKNFWEDRWGFEAVALVIDLFHKVSEHSSENKMNSTNLALVFSPNLIVSSNPLLDAQIASIPGFSTLPPIGGDFNASKHPTLGQIMKLCIDHYDEVFAGAIMLSPSTGRSDLNQMNSVNPVMPITGGILSKNFFEDDDD